MKMSTRKYNYIGLIIAYSILFVLFNVLIFVIFKPWNFEKTACIAAFWWSYAFFTIAFLAQLSSLFVIDRKKEITAVFMGIPLFYISIGYFLAATFVSALFMVLASFKVETPLELVIVLQIVLLGLYLVAFILALLTKRTISDIGEHQKENVAHIRIMVDKVELCAEMIEDQSTKKSIMEFAENIRYSDPMSTKVVENLDKKLNLLIDELKSATLLKDLDKIQLLLREGNLTLLERNKMIVSNK